jgi:hypothetical protein
VTRVPENDLKVIALKAAQSVLGPGKVETVDVVSGNDSSDEPAYFISFMIDQDRDAERAVRLWNRLAEKIRDTLVERGDEAYPYVDIRYRSDAQGWERAPPL